MQHLQPPPFVMLVRMMEPTSANERYWTQMMLEWRTSMHIIAPLKEGEPAIRIDRRNLLFLYPYAEESTMATKKLDLLLICCPGNSVLSHTHACFTR